MSHFLYGASKMLRKLERHITLHNSDRDALLALANKGRTIAPNQYMIREGDVSTDCYLILDGFAFRQKITRAGARQIVSLHLPGDLVNLETSMLRKADHSVQALTRCEVALLSYSAIRDLQIEHPIIGHAMWLEALVDGSIYREWLLNIGQRDSRARVAHILCEFGRRLELVGLEGRSAYDFPMTQEQLGGATGLTPVHVNRTLKALESEGFITTKRRLVSVSNWPGLREVSGFSDAYLHIDD